MSACSVASEKEEGRNESGGDECIRGRQDYLRVARALRQVRTHRHGASFHDGVHDHSREALAELTPPPDVARGPRRLLR